VPDIRKQPWKHFRREALLLAVPVLALVVFGFISLRWEKRAQEEEIRSRCLALAEPLRREFFTQLAEVDYLRNDILSANIESLPDPGEKSDSLTKFLDGEYQAVLGDAGALSETGLPLRPLAAIRLIRTEKDPVRLEELVKVIAAEPGFLTKPLLRDAEERFKQLALPLPNILEGWEDQLERASRVQRILKGANPEDLLSESETSRWLGEKEAMLLLKSPSGSALVDRASLHKIIASSQSTVSDVLPVGVEAIVNFPPSRLAHSDEIAFDGGTPSIHFVVSDAAAFNQLSNRRRGLFAGFLTIATILSVIGVIFLLRSVARERELAIRKGNLIAAVSHEMRTPVASIRLLAENLATGAADTKKRKASHQNQLLEQSERLSTLVENVLNYSKRDAGRADWQMAPLKIDELLENSATQFKALAERQKVSLEWTSDPLKIKPHGDAAALEQALTNLIDNALKHSPKNGKVRFGTSDQPDGWSLWVSDDGPGIPKEKRKQVFEAFYRMGSELRRETKGTGLGLALVQQVAEAHGGEARCLESKSGGARFEIQLPFSPTT